MTTTSKQTHTETPWSVAYFDDESVPIVIGHNGDERICEMHSNEEPQARIDANAAHIVYCVNAHDELVEALQVICARFQGHYDHPGLVARGTLNVSMANDMYFYAEAALVKAQKGQP